MANEPKAPDTEDKEVIPAGGKASEAVVSDTAKGEDEESPKSEEKVAEDSILGETIEDIEKKAKDETKPEPRLVPEAVLLEYKNQNKELKKDLKDLKQLIESGATKKEISEDIRDIAEEHNVDVNFLKKLVHKIEDDNERKIEEKIAAQIKPYQDKERQERINKLFDQHWRKVLEELPEYKGIANKEVIRERALNPLNSKKTFKQILDESYGHLVSGKYTMESARSRAGEGEIGQIDYNRAARDMAYYDKIMADPALKAEYNKNLHKRIPF